MTRTLMHVSAVLIAVNVGLMLVTLGVAMADGNRLAALLSISAALGWGQALLLRLSSPTVKETE